MDTGARGAMTVDSEHLFVFNCLSGEHLFEEGKSDVGRL